MLRRNFFALPAAFAMAAEADTRVFATGDGVPLTSEEYARLISGASADDYSRGGVVEQLESRVAAALGKEAAVWMPTGTLANHLAVRTLAEKGHRVLVQAESHLYNDCGDCAQTLSALNLIPLAPGNATFSFDEAERAANAALTGRVLAPVGAIQIESPVRRRRGERFDFEQMKKISTWARGQKIGMHLDGARIFLESAYSGRPVREYAALFDTVYISMYKYFNAASGAMLAGPKSLLAEMYHPRRMFGGGLHQVWPFAAVALHYFDGFDQRLSKAVENSERVIAELKRDPSFEIERIPNGTNIFRLRTPNVNGPTYRGRLDAAGVSAGAAVDGWFNMQVNETWSRVPAEEIASRFRRALG